MVVDILVLKFIKFWARGWLGVFDGGGTKMLGSSILYALFTASYIIII